MFLEKITGLTQSQLFLCTPQISPQEIKTLNDYIQRFESGEPLEYILETAIFYGLDFFVNTDVLIPRNDTEVMVDQILREQGENYIIDVWTGSWAILWSILHLASFKIKWAYAIDISQKAILVAEKNLQRYSNKNIITIMHWNLLEPIFHIHKTSFQDANIIISANLPYIKNNDFQNMSPETIIYEPDIALYGWEETGFELYEQLIDQCLRLKKEKNIKKITLYIEIWFDQYNYSQEYLMKKSKHSIYYKDNSWIYRCIKIIF